MSYEEIARSEKPLKELKEFEDEFLNDRLKELKVLNESLNCGNLSEIRALAHKWKGFCDPYGFQKLGELSSELEIKSAEKDVIKTTHLIEEINKYLQAKNDYINR